MEYVNTCIAVLPSSKLFRFCPFNKQNMAVVWQLPGILIMLFGIFKFNLNAVASAGNESIVFHDPLKIDNDKDLYWDEDQYNSVFSSGQTDYNGHRCQDSNPLIAQLVFHKDECGAVVKDSSGEISAPNWYPKNIFCNWVICAEEGKYILIHPSEFWLNKDENCDHEYLKLCDGCYYSQNGSFVEGKIYTFCGEGSSPQIISTTGIVSIGFKSSRAKPAKLVDPFVIEYQIFDFDPSCGGKYSTESGILQSPGFPQTRPNEIECFWEINVPIGQRIIFEVVTFNVESTDECADKLLMIDGVYLPYPSISKFTAETPPRSSFRSNSNSVQFRFTSDYCDESQMRFKFIWNVSDVDCNETFYASSGIIESPNFLNKWQPELSCWWKIVVNTGTTIRFTFLNWDAKVYDSSSCNTAYMMIADGLNDTDKHLGKWCYQKDIPSVIDTSGNMALVILKTFSNRLVRIGFRIRFETVCTRVLTSFYGTIESINFPELYPPNTKCSWIIDVGKDSDLLLNFTHVDLKSITWSDDYIQIITKEEDTGSSTKIEKILKLSRLPYVKMLYGMSVEILFQAFNSLTPVGHGFKLDWELKGCRYDLTGNNGTFHSPGYPKAYQQNSHCKWRITTDVGTRVVLTINRHEIENSTNCQFDGLKIYSGFDNTHNKLAHLCGDLDYAVVVTSDENQMFLEFYSDDSLIFSGFSATFEEIPAENGHFCGGIFSGESGYIYSPNFPNNYNNLDNCTWIITVNPNYKVGLTFIEFDIEDMYDANCTFDNVTVFEEHPGNIVPIGIFCRTKKYVPDVIVSSSNSMSIRLLTSDIDTRKGFKAHYFQKCGAILSNETGTIRNPEFMSIMHGAGNCTWTIKATSPKRRVALIFIKFSWPITDPFCSKHNVRVHDGDTSTFLETPLLYIGCCNNVPPPLISSGNVVTLQIINAEALKFQAIYFIIPEECAFTTEDELLTRGDNGNYKNGSIDKRCTGVATINQNEIRVSFRPYHWESHRNDCDTSFVEINGENISRTEPARFCRKEIRVSKSTKEYWIVRLKVGGNNSVDNLESTRKAVNDEYQERAKNTSATDPLSNNLLGIYTILTMVFHILKVLIEGENCFNV